MPKRSTPSVGAYRASARQPGAFCRPIPGVGERHKGLDLAAAYGARNRYVHGYFDLDTEQMWNIAAFAVPRLSSAVGKILKNEGM
jgi:uncharacterized protein with HEPN domain